MDIMEVADPDAVHAVRSFIRKQLASELRAELLSTVCYLPRSNYFFISTSILTFVYKLTLPLYIKQVEKNRSSEDYVFNHPNMARRALKNVALGLCYSE